MLKPSERDPSASNFVAELYHEAGLPDGVFNVVHGDKVAVDALLEHPGVDAVSFVGSTPIARYVYETGTRHGKRVQALGGAKNHAVVLPDADLEFTANHLTAAGYGSAGQRCMAIAVTVAVGDVAEPLIERLREKALAVKVGPGLDPDSEMGPVVTPQARDRIVGYIDQGVDAGADAVVDGRGIERDGDGFWVGPTLFDKVTPEMSIYRDEIFGPVLSVVRVDTLAEAIELINANPYANGTAIFTSSGQAARIFQREVHVGHDRHQRPDPGADGLLLLRRLEGLPVRRPPHPRPRGRALLHARQGDHQPLARRGAGRRAPPRPHALPDRRLTHGACGSGSSAPGSWGRTHVRLLAHGRARRGGRRGLRRRWPRTRSGSPRRPASARSTPRPRS